MSNKIMIEQRHLFYFFLPFETKTSVIIIHKKLNGMKSVKKDY